MRTCPGCSLLNPDSAIVCDCGHVLDAAAAGSLSAAALRPPVPPKRDRIVLSGGARMVAGVGGFFLGVVVETFIAAALQIDMRRLGLHVPAGIGGALLLLHLVEEPPAARANYLARHWRGELPLGVSYWVGGWFVEMAIVFADRLSSGTPVLSAIAWAGCGVGEIWYVVGTWRSSERTTARGDVSFRAWLAKIGVLVGAMVFVALFMVRALPVLRGALDLGRG